MNNISRIFTLVLVCIFAIGLSSVDAQTYGRKKKKKKKTEKVEDKKTSKSDDDDYFNDRGTIGSRLWYGLHVGNIGGANGTFNINLTPVVGYKFTDDVSAGVMLKFNYTYLGRTWLESRGINGVRKWEPLDLGPAIFARGKLFETFFVHTEFEFGSFQEFSGIDGDKIQSESYNEQFLYVGAGYNGARGGLGYEIGLYYNVLDSAESVARTTPWDLRLGFTYKF